MEGSKEACRVNRVALGEMTRNKEAAQSLMLLSRRFSIQVPSHLPPLDPGGISLKGLLTAHKFSKGLKARTAQKLADKKGVRGPERKPISIHLEQVPHGCARPRECFPTACVSHLIQDFLASRMEAVPYSGRGVPSYSISAPPALSQTLSEELRRQVRSICPPRYRLVCTVSLGPAGQKGLAMASRCLWDAHTDSCVSHTIETANVFCMALVFAVYCE